MTLISLVFKTMFFYIFIIVCYRLMGKREIGKLSLSDLTISILIAELVAIAIENVDDSIFYAVMPILVLVALEILFAFLELKVSNFRELIDGKPSVIINNHKINIKEMIKQRYSMNDLLTSLRINGVDNVKDVKYAVLETNGSLSVFKKNSTYPLPLIIDGEIYYDSIKNIQKSSKWLENKLKKYNVKVEEILYAFLKNNIIYIIKNK